MDDIDDKLQKEVELETQMLALQKQLADLRAANRADVVADVKAKIKRYAITKTELATAFPVLRRSKADLAATTPKKRGRKPKVQASDSTT